MKTTREWLYVSWRKIREGRFHTGKKKKKTHAKEAMLKSVEWENIVQVFSCA